MTYLLYTYLALTAFKIGNVLLLFGILFAIVLSANFVWVGVHNDVAEDDDKLKYPSLKYFIISGGIVLLSTLFPSKDDAYLLLGAYVSQNVVESDISKELLNNIEARIKSSTEDILNGAGKFKVVIE